MRRPEYKAKTHEEGVSRGGERSTARADVLASQETRPMLGDLPSSTNPRILFEFVSQPIEPYVSQSMDIIEAFDKAW
jgi:hypothetical protein